MCAVYVWTSVHVWLSVFACICVSLCAWVRAANILVVGMEIHYNGLIGCGGANGSSPGLSHVVDTRLGQGALKLVLQANKRFTNAYTSCYPYIHFMLPIHALHSAWEEPRTVRQGVLRTMLLPLAHLQSCCSPGQIFYASNWLFSAKWPGDWLCHIRVVDMNRDGRWKDERKSVCVCM